jgi:hypothetical protein
MVESLRPVDSGVFRGRGHRASRPCPPFGKRKRKEKSRRKKRVRSEEERAEAMPNASNTPTN